MVKSLLAGIVMMMWCLAAMATPPSVVGTPRALPFKVKTEKAVTNPVPTNLVYCKDMTPKWLDDRTTVRDGVLKPVDIDSNFAIKLGQRRSSVAGLTKIFD